VALAHGRARGDYASSVRADAVRVLDDRGESQLADASF
jgi:hypothetical protein